MTELLVLGGERVAAAEGATTGVVEPSTGEPAWEVAQASPDGATRRVRGVISRAQIERQLGRPVQVTQIASSFSEIERALL